MNMDYSKVFELLNQDAEKERNEKAENLVHDNLYNKGFRDGLAVLDKIRSEIMQEYKIECEHPYRRGLPYRQGLKRTIEILDKYKAESGG